MKRKFEVVLFSNIILVIWWAEFNSGLPVRGRLCNSIASQRVDMNCEGDSYNLS